MVRARQASNQSLQNKRSEKQMQIRLSLHRLIITLVRPCIQPTIDNQPPPPPSHRRQLNRKLGKYQLYIEQGICKANAGRCQTTKRKNSNKSSSRPDILASHAGPADIGVRGTDLMAMVRNDEPKPL